MFTLTEKKFLLNLLDDFRDVLLEEDYGIYESSSYQHAKKAKLDNLEILREKIRLAPETELEKT